MQSTPAFDQAIRILDTLRSAIGKVIRGRSDTVNMLLAALVADGHVLLEDYPGSGKTTLTKTLGGLIDSHLAGSRQEYILPFRRIQFTPDMLPGDVLGVNVFDPKTGNFQFLHGPIFAHVVLADEINRTGPKVQAAFLECMAEKQVTIDNVTHPLDDFFFVVGTQNPIDFAGTYPLPLVQLDRFMFKIPMKYVDRSTEVEILSTHTQINTNLSHLTPVCSRADVLAARSACESVTVSQHLREACVDIVRATRESPLLQFGASTRAALMLQRGIQGWALVNGRAYASEDDLKTICPLVLLHRLKFHAGAGDAAKALQQIISPQLERLISRAMN